MGYLLIFTVFIFKTEVNYKQKIKNKKIEV